MRAPFDQPAAALRSTLVLLFAGASLAACATTGSRDFNAPPSREPSSRAQSSRQAPPPRSSGAHGTSAPYQVGGRWYYPHAQPDYDEVGVASWYGAKFHNHTTANGEIFDQDGVSAAHTTLPLPSIIEVTNLANGRRLRVRLNDRGPFVDGRILDLSREAAAELGFEQQGVAQVRVRYIGPAPPLASGVMLASAPARRSEPAAATPPPAPVLPPYETVAMASPPVVRPSVPTAETSPGPVAIPAPVATQAPSTPMVIAAPPSASYAIQAAAFRSRDNAERAAAMLAEAGRTSIQPVEGAGGTLYRVMVIGFPDEDSAAEAWVRVRDAGFPGARVVGPG